MTLIQARDLTAPPVRAGSATGARLRPRKWAMRMVFAAMVALPTLAAAFFYGFVAADRYVAEARVAARASHLQEDKAAYLKKAALSMFSLSPSDAMTNAAIVENLVLSRDMVKALDVNGRLRAIYSRPEADLISRFDPDYSNERLWKYWKRMIEADIDPVTGIVTIKAQAFRPDDALWISREVISKLEQFANEYDQRGRDDMLRFANGEVERASAKYLDATIALRDYRDVSGKFDAAGDAASRLTSLLSVLKHKIDLEIEIGAEASLSSSSPNLAAKRAQVQSLQRQFDDINATITAKNPQTETVSAAISRFERLEVDRAYSGVLYNSARAGYERARVEATRQHVYIFPFIAPRQPDEAVFPRRWVNVLLVFTCALILWGLLRTIIALIADQSI
jgi:capsular polysaccharide transport system permease protein